MHELKKAIEGVLALVDAPGLEPDDNMYMVLEHNSTMGEFEFAIDHLREVYEGVKERL